MRGCQPLFCICGCRLPQRVVAVLLCSLGVIVAYGQRTDVNVAITRLVSPNIRNLSQGCPTNVTEVAPIEGGTKEWTELIQGMILGSFYVGYLIGQVPAGIIADLFGPRWVYAGGIFASSLISLVTPVTIQYLHWTLVVFSRIISGIAQSVIFPSISILVSRWVPFKERSTLGALTYSSVALGVIVGNTISGFIMYYMNNWPNVFYFWGMSGLLWTATFLLYVYSDFKVHPHILESEMKFLSENIESLTRRKIPYKRIITDKGIIAMIIGQIGHDITVFLCVTNIPKYQSDVLRLSVRDVSIISSVPFTGAWLSGIVSGKICDIIASYSKTRRSLKLNRGVTTLVSFAGTSTFLVLMTYAGCNIPLSVTCYAIAVTFIGPFCASHKVNQMDITVNYNGFVMSLINGVGCFTGFSTPLFISLVAKDNTLWQWQIVGWYICLMTCFAGLYYAFMLEVNRAEWDVPPDQHDEWRQKLDDKTAEEEQLKQMEKTKKAEKQAAKDFANQSKVATI